MVYIGSSPKTVLVNHYTSDHAILSALLILTIIPASPVRCQSSGIRLSGYRASPSACLQQRTKELCFYLLL